MPERYNIENIRIPGVDPELLGEELSPEVIERGQKEFDRKEFALIKESLDMQSKGESYRDFRVSATVLGMIPIKKTVLKFIQLIIGSL